MEWLINAIVGAFLERELWDQFVSGIRDQNTQIKLLEEDIAFQDCVGSRQNWKTGVCCLSNCNFRKFSSTFHKAQIPSEEKDYYYYYYYFG